MEQPVYPSCRCRHPGLSAGLFSIFSLIVACRSPDRAPAHAYPIPSADDRITVEVLNGAGTPGLARLGARVLRSGGLDVVFFGNGDTAGGATTRVYARRPDKRRAADQARAALGVGVVSEQVDTLRRVDVTVILGRDFHPDLPLHP